jgi:hypothetical protein
MKNRFFLNLINLNLALAFGGITTFYVISDFVASVFLQNLSLMVILPL